MTMADEFLGLLMICPFSISEIGKKESQINHWFSSFSLLSHNLPHLSFLFSKKAFPNPENPRIISPPIFERLRLPSYMMLSHPLHWKKAVHNFIGLIYVPSSNLYYCTATLRKVPYRSILVHDTKFFEWRGSSGEVLVLLRHCSSTLLCHYYPGEINKKKFFFSENQRFSIGIAVASCFAFLYCFMRRRKKQAS